MSHRLGSVLAASPLQIVGPGNGTQVSPGRWKVTFSPPAAPGGTKFLMLHFTAAALGAGDRLEVDLIYDTDVFTNASGPDFWSRPIKGNSVDIFFVDGGGGAGQATLSQFGRGEGLQNNGAANTNADVFLIDSPYQEPTFFNSAGVCPGGASPSWENADCLPAGLMRDVARSVGMFIEASGSNLSSCSAALIGPDLILTAGHCVASGSEIPSGSFTLDYQTDCFRNRPAGYNPKFHKLKRIVKTGFAVAGVGAGVSTGSGLDYAVVQFEAPPGGLGVPPLPMRASLPALGEELFVIHHPRGVTKKVSRKPTDPTCQMLSVNGSVISYACDSDNGSSGSPVIDLAGRIVAVNDWAPGSCNNQGQATAAILPDLAAGPPPAKDVDVVLVLDRSGSMSLTGLSGQTKIQEAREAAALFIDLLRTDRTHRVGLVTFSTTSGPPEFTLAPITPANKDVLIGPAPLRNAGIVGGIAPGGATTIGGGLHAGQQQLPVPTPAANTPAILLMTDGLQNTPPMIADVEPELGVTKLCIIGFGTEASLDGPLLTTLARDHGGIYTRAGEGLELKKFFVLAFGNIFQTAVSMDPLFTFAAGATNAAPIPFQVCGEELLTVVLGWETGGEQLFLSLVTPAGNTITSTSPGIFASSGNTWVYFRVPLPLNGERNGAWQVRVFRSGGAEEFPAPLKPQRFFVTVVVDGGPFFRRLAPRRYYTGDTINPQVVLREPSGFVVDAKVTVEVETPDDGTGNILTRTGLRPPTELSSDQLDSRASTLMALEQERGGKLTGVTTTAIELFDDGEIDGDGALEPDGVFGNPQKDLARIEGNYTFRARAVYGESCTGTRETSWTVYVQVGIDPGKTEVTTEVVGDLPDGRRRVRIKFCPRDRYGNYLGPGRAASFQINSQPGSTVIGSVLDLGNGCYTQDVAWDPAATDDPSISVTQPGRPPVVIGPLPLGRFSYSVKFVCGVQADQDCGCQPLRPGHYATEINIHNFQEREAKIEKRILPLVLAGAARGREPSVVRPAGIDTLVLPPHTATMDDCCRIAELLFGAPPAQPLPLTLGFLEIVSPVELKVTAVYTVTDLKSGSASIDVKTVEAKRVR
ncbi:MAG: trypsin-like peptidase domain-containing protein [Bryobacteraceae bacterium]